MSNSQLKVELQDGKVVISIGMDTLCNSFSVTPSYGLNEVKITNKEVFIAAVLAELALGNEDGSNVVNEMFERAADKAIENGCDGVSVKNIFGRLMYQLSCKGIRVA